MLRRAEPVNLPPADRILWKTRLRSLLRAAVLLVGWAAVARGGESIAIHGKTIHTMAGAAIADGVVLVADGKIVAVGPAAAVPVPAGARTLRAEVVTPGLIDAHCVIGLAGYLNQDHDQDQFDATEPVQPELRAIDAYNPRERLVEWVRGFGVTTLHTGHAPAALVSGQTMVVKTAGDSPILRPTAMIAVTLAMPAASPATRNPPARAASRWPCSAPN